MTHMQPIEKKGELGMADRVRSNSTSEFSFYAGVC